mgnify:CR=1 FL=1
MDMVIVCNLDNVRKSMVLHDVNDAAVYDQLWNCLAEGDRPDWYKYYGCTPHHNMTQAETAMVDEMKALIKDQNELICIQDSHIEELQQQMSDMVNKEYDC